MKYLIRKKNISSSYVPIEKLNKLSKNLNHQGAVARISSISFTELENLIESISKQNKTPLFLLDDVFGELDAARANKISDYLKEVGQAFVTLTDFGNFSFLKKDGDDNLIKLNGGEIVYA